jgi:hypothetical protein
LCRSTILLWHAPRADPLTVTGAYIAALSDRVTAGSNGRSARYLRLIPYV